MYKLSRKNRLKIYSIEGPACFVRSSKRSLIVDAEYQRAGMCVRKLRGNKCTTHRDFMFEFGAALQVFYEFGENWSAVAEIIRVMDEWLPAKGYVLVVEHAEAMFSAEPIEWTTFLKVVSIAKEWWSSPVVGNGRFDRDALPFSVVFESSDPSFVSMLESLGTEFTVLD